MKLTKYIVALLAIGAVSLNAQMDPPQGSVDEQGRLVLPGMDPIDPPTGTVDQDGNLVIGDQTILKPSATVNPDGSLTVDGQNIPVPEIPVLVFWQETYNFGGNAWFQNVLGAFWTTEGTNWVYALNFSALNGGSGGWCWIATASGNDDAFWFYNAGFAEWIYFSTGGDGLKKIWSTPDGLQNGFFYLNGTGWVYYLEEKKDGFHWGYVTVDGGNSYITTRQNALPQ